MRSISETVCYFHLLSIIHGWGMWSTTMYGACLLKTRSKRNGIQMAPGTATFALDTPATA